MQFNAQIKKGAKSALRGNWGKIIAGLFVFIGFWLLLSTVETLIYLLCGLDPYAAGTIRSLFDPYPGVSGLVPASILITAGCSLLWLLFFSPLFCGCIRWIYALSGGDTPEFRELFRYFTSFRRWCRSIAASLQVLVRALLWLAAFAALPAAVFVFFRTFPIPQTSPLAQFSGFGTTAGWALMTIAVFFYLVFLQRYTLVFYYLAENESLSARKAVKESIRATDGHCSEVFRLRLSFFWWALLCLLVMPFLYVLPYYHTSIAIYARYLMEYRRRADEEPPAPPSEWMEKPEDPAGELPASDDKTQEYPVSEVRQHMEQ